MRGLGRGLKPGRIRWWSCEAALASRLALRPYCLKSRRSTNPNETMRLSRRKNRLALSRLGILVTVAKMPDSRPSRSAAGRRRGACSRPRFPASQTADFEAPASRERCSRTGSAAPAIGHRSSIREKCSASVRPHRVHVRWATRIGATAFRRSEGRRRWRAGDKHPPRDGKNCDRGRSCARRLDNASGEQGQSVVLVFYYIGLIVRDRYFNLSRGAGE
jgi:hypothetical protein